MMIAIIMKLLLLLFWTCEAVEQAKPLIAYIRVFNNKHCCSRRPSFLSSPIVYQSAPSIHHSLICPYTHSFIHLLVHASNRVRGQAERGRTRPLPHKMHTRARKGCTQHLQAAKVKHARRCESRSRLKLFRRICVGINTCWKSLPFFFCPLRLLLCAYRDKTGACFRHRYEYGYSYISIISVATDGEDPATISLPPFPHTAFAAAVARCLLSVCRRRTLVSPLDADESLVGPKVEPAAYCCSIGSVSPASLFLSLHGWVCRQGAQRGSTVQRPWAECRGSELVAGLTAPRTRP